MSSQQYEESSKACTSVNIESMVYNSTFYVYCNDKSAFGTSGRWDARKRGAPNARSKKLGLLDGYRDAMTSMFLRRILVILFRGSLRLGGGQVR